MHLPCLRTPFAPALLRTLLRAQSRAGSSASSSRWRIERARDQYKKGEFLEHINRAGPKLVQIQDTFNIFRLGQTVVDLGFAPGAWSEVALKHTGPRGRVVGVDILPATPPRGVSTFQGDFRSPAVQAVVRKYLLDPERGRPRLRMLRLDEQAEGDVVEMERGYIDRERLTEKEDNASDGKEGASEEKTVDVVLSDMLMATSGITSRDHFVSMDLCFSALSFCIDVLRPGGSFVCKYYKGKEEGILEQKAKMAFKYVQTYKPDASRLELMQGSPEQYYICRDMVGGVRKEDVFPDQRFMLGGS